MRLLRALSLFLVCIAALSIGGVANAQNFSNRSTVIVDLCPHVKLSEVEFYNERERVGDRFVHRAEWTNSGAQPVVAFELVFINVDPFKRLLKGDRWTVVGNSSVDWSPLMPGQKKGDGLITVGARYVYASLVYVATVRLADGTVWSVDQRQLEAAVRAEGARLGMPDLKP